MTAIRRQPKPARLPSGSATRPYGRGKTESLCVRLRPETKQRIERLATRQNISLAHALELLIDRSPA
jgi:hypothetical protein